MLIPCIDLMGGKVVQLVQGEKKALEFTDAEPWIRKFEKYPLVHVVDLDAAKREGSNRELVSALSKRMHCQVGGGISSSAIARDVLAAGAQRVVVGSALVNQVRDTLTRAGKPTAKTAKAVFELTSKLARGVRLASAAMVASGARK